MTKQDVLTKCILVDNVIRIPSDLGQLDRKLYQEVAKAIELIGGKWKGGKIAGFVFPDGYEDKIDGLLGKIASGDNVNLKKEYQFFGTPEKLADHLVELAEIKKTDKVLEPSAGQAALIEAVNKQINLNDPVDYIELMDINRNIINIKKSKDGLIANELPINDFLELTDKNDYYDVVIANPPFTKNQDIDHIRKMYEVCKKGGTIISISSVSWTIGSQKKQIAFKNWLEEIKANIYPVETGAFKESGTMIATVIIKIIK